MIYWIKIIPKAYACMFIFLLLDSILRFSPYLPNYLSHKKVSGTTFQGISVRVQWHLNFGNLFRQSKVIKKRDFGTKFRKFKMVAKKKNLV